MIENHVFNKKFGQNFISDKNLLAAIVKDANISEFDEVLEIGAGAGALTEELAKAAKKVVSYEIDKTLTEHLKEIEEKYENLTIKIQDALKTKIEELEKDFDGEYCLVANLPYYITSPLIFKFLEETEKCKSITVMVQKEVGERFCAKAGSKNYGIPSVMIDFYCTCKIMRNVSRKMFFPEPNVDSCVIRLDRKEIKQNKDFDSFFKKIVNSAFSMRRKTLANNLTKSLSINREKCLNAILKIGKSESVRAEELTLNDFLNLAKELSV